MREIEFRAWDKINKEWLDIFKIVLSSDGSVMSVETLDGESYGMHQVDLMQFAGLKDKNGKEIYEGDRCNVLFANGEKHKAEVVFIDGCFELNFYYPIVIGGHYNDRGYLKCSTVNHAVEVIGNIYENPELKEG